MAKATLDPLIRSISGRVGMLVFYTYRDTQYLRRYVVPRNPNTPAQKSRRELFAEAVALWKKLTEPKKAQWNRKAQGQIMSGYNLFISVHLHARNDLDCSQNVRPPVSFSHQIRSHSVYTSGRERDGFGMHYNELFSCAETGPPPIPSLMQFM